MTFPHPQSDRCFVSSQAYLVRGVGDWVLAGAAWTRKRYILPVRQMDEGHAEWNKPEVVKTAQAERGRPP